MKKIIALALALVMSMVLLCACGETLVSPTGVYATESGTYKVEFSGYNADDNVGTMTVTFTVIEVPTVVTGTYSVAVNDPDANTFFIDFTPNGGEVIEGCMIYDANQDVLGQYENLPEVEGKGSSYYRYTGE